ncbi:MAG TPA: penicillin-binding protein 2 [Caulobacteraceae bacterium]|jgi:penicillin-binding protein 2|nr:penicillin-binding protein 2 [Caulobacteraceae bacterium]
MSEPAFHFDEVNERQSRFHRRAFLFGGITGVGILALVGRLGQLQILEAGRYRMLSEHNEFEFRLTPPPRGLILDRNGVVLASNRPAFRLLVATDTGVDVDETLANIARLAPMDDARRARLAADIAAAPRKAPVAVIEDMTWEEFARINVRAPELPGVTADMGEVRVYPFGGAFAHVVGYVAKVNAADIAKTGPNADPILLNPGFRIGRQGVEKAYDLDLRGKAGARKVEVDVKGRVVRDDPGGDIPSVPGAPIRLTLDADIQNRALEVFGEDSGAAVMMDCRTGDVLCLASAPSFDANRFVKGLTGPEYKALAGYDRKPLFNKALTANYPPGSTFKTMVALAALEAGVDPARTYVCNRVWFWGGRPWHCDKAHGVVDMHNAIKSSCDIFFYQTALSVGPDKIAATARKFGLGQVFDPGNIPGQKAGIVPDIAYKRRAFPHDPVWHPGETPSMGIGQGYVSVNALQLAVMVSRLANGSRAIQPRLIHSIGDAVQPLGSEAPELPFAKAHLDFVRTAMASVANDAGGTAFKASQLGLGPIKMAGKTGTAQSHSYTAAAHGAHGAQGVWAMRDHAWFVAFAPYDDPRYAMSVLVEHGGWGAEAAAPKAAQLMRIALLKDPEVRSRIVSPLPREGGAAAPGLPDGSAT